MMSERVRICEPRSGAELDFRPVARLLRELCEGIEMRGALEVEMIYADRTYRVIEINPRTSGTTVISTAASGCNTIQCLLDILRGQWSASRARALRRRSHCALQIPVVPPFDGARLRAGGAPAALEVVRTRNFAYHGRDFGEVLLRCPVEDAPALEDVLGWLRTDCGFALPESVERLRSGDRRPGRTGAAIPVP